MHKGRRQPGRVALSDQSKFDKFDHESMFCGLCYIPLEAWISTTYCLVVHGDSNRDVVA